MTKLYRLLYLAGFVIICVGVPLAVILMFELDSIWLLLALPLIFVLLKPMSRIESMLEMKEHEKRGERIYELLDQCLVMGGKDERAYQQQLLRHLLEQTTTPRPEAPLPTGTKVDAHIIIDNADWYITIKRGLKNQQRLILQGEIEDILLHAPRRDRDLWIIVIVGMQEDDDPSEWSQFGNLLDYAAHRMVFNTRRHQTGEKDIDVRIEVVPAMIPKNLNVD